MRIEPTPAVGVALAICAAALASGGSGGVALGVAVAVTWALLGALAVANRLELRSLSGELIACVGALAALAALAALSMGWGFDDGAAFEEVVRLCGYTGLVLLVGLLARRRSVPSWLAGVALGGTLVAVFSIVARVVGFGGDADLARELPGAVERLSYPLGYWNALGYLMAMTIPPLAYLALAADRPVARAAAAGSVPVVLALFLTSSRGALFAAAIGLLAFLLVAPERRRLPHAAIAVLPAWLLVVGVAGLQRDALDPISGELGWALGVVGVAAAAAIGSQALFARLEGSRPTGRVGRRSVAPALAAAIAIGAALLVLGGPSTLIGEFRAAPADRSSGEALLSDSGRLSFWDAALDAYADDPARGQGAGGFASYWARNGELDVPVTNAHSLPLETLAELGTAGGLLLVVLLGAVLLAAVRRTRGAVRGERSAVGATVGVLLVGAIAIGFDWTWQVPAAVLPLLLAIGLLSGGALRPEVRSASLHPGIRGVARVGLCAGALAVIWAAGVLAVTESELDRSSDRLEAGDLTRAAEHARVAAEIQPWAAEPHYALATIEREAANLEAARRRARRAAELAPRDARPWLLLGLVESELGNPESASSYFRRAGALGLDRLRFRLDGP